ncbi:hypothetical protein H4R19_001926 [Coemansia spiralis]|nr:hypothetical protein H4R19_001926 [Coemansia spiralis]
MKLLATAVGIAALAIGNRAASSAPAAAALGLSSELGSLGPEHVERRSSDNGGIAWRTLSPPDLRQTVSSQSHPPPMPTADSSSSYHYSFAVDLSGFDGSITHYHVSYSDPQVSGEVGVGHAEPTPTPVTPIIIHGLVCDESFPGLLSGLGLDLGLRLNLGLIGVDACVAL